MTMMQTDSFGELVLEKRVVAALKEMGFEEPSPIQQQAIPLLLEGRDIIGQAQTGTGKTAAFGIPIIQGIEDRRHIQALIMSPTRELAIQIAEEIAKIGFNKRIKVVPVYGGQPIERQIRALKSGVQIVIGTPGRLLDHIRRGTIKLNYVRYLVLDEADEMLDMGFVEDMEEIMASVPSERQTMLFSATMPRPILSLTKKYMRAPQIVTVSKEEITVPLIDQYYFETRDKIEGISRLLDAGIEGKSIIFCRTKRGVDDLTASLGSRGYIAEGLHGDLSQAQRDRVMKKFREGRLDILIATDVAARGLDIDNVQYVINFDIPQDPESYVHRIGRTGRAGNTGVALTFILPREFRQLKLIERIAKTRIRRRELPTTSDVLEHQREQIISRMQSLLEMGNYGNYMPVVTALSKEYELEEIAAAALKLMQEGNRALEITEEKNTISDLTDQSLANTGGRPGMVRFFLNVGRSQKITVPELVRTIAREADIPGRSIGLINIFDKFSFVEVPEQYAEKVLAVMHKNSIRGYKVNIEPAHSKGMKEILGNTEGLKNNIIAMLEQLYQLRVPPWQLVSPEIAIQMAKITGAINREVNIFLDRKGNVLSVSVGDSNTVSLPDLPGRRGSGRLSGVRCIHTHPGGNSQLSGIDLSALRSHKYDLMAAIGVNDEKPEEFVYAAGSSRERTSMDSTRFRNTAYSNRRYWKHCFCQILSVRQKNFWL